jgi:hypothetical protein
MVKFHTTGKSTRSTSESAKDLLYFPQLYQLVLTCSPFRNGVNMGVAYSDVPRGSGIAYFPAVSLSYCESCQLNFGATPFMYPLR